MEAVQLREPQHAAKPLKHTDKNLSNWGEVKLELCPKNVSLNLF